MKIKTFFGWNFCFLFLVTLLISLGIGITWVKAQNSTVNFSGTVTDANLSKNNQILALTSELTTQVDRFFSQEFTDFLEVTPKNNLTLLELPNFLATMDKETGTKSAIVYVYLQAIGQDILQEATKAGPLDSLTGGVIPPNRNPQPTDSLVLIVATSNGLFTPVPVPNANRRDLLALQKQFQNNLVNLAPKEAYLPQSIKIYEWLVTPIREMLQKQGINHISFILDAGLRSLPIAALYDQKQGKYLIEEFSLGLMPSLSLTNITRKTDTNPKVLAMGADTFKGQNPLPAVPAELEEIAKVLWNGSIYLNQDFTVKNFKTAIATREFSLVHLATHGEFQPGDRNKSFVVFTDQNLKMDQFANTGLDQPIDLMTLSACRTALGDPQAELGFAGIAVKTGVRTAIGSLWYVSDEGTFALMTNFYNYLKKAPTKAQSLQLAQRGMISGQVDINKEGQITINNLGIRGASLPPQVREELSTKDISHPYFWSAFTLIGNPW